MLYFLSDAQSSLSIFAHHKYLRKCKDTYFILQNNIVLEQRCLVMIAPYLDTLLIQTIFKVYLIPILGVIW